MAKYLATSLAMEKVVSAPRVIRSCLPISTISMSFVGSLSRSTMLPASRAAMVPVFMATPTSACARAGASLVPSPHMATSLPFACSSRISFSFISGVACARKSSTPDSAAMAAAVSGLSPVIITVRMPILRRLAKRSRMPPFTMSFRCMTPSSFPSFATASGVPPDLAMRSTMLRKSRAVSAPSASTAAAAASPPAAENPLAARTCPITASTAPLRMEEPSMSTPLMRVCAVKGTKVACVALISRPRNPYFSFASTTMERPSGVSSESEDSCAASARSCSLTPGRARNSDAWRLPSVIVPVLSSNNVSTSPAASTARPDMASTLKRTNRSMPAMPMAESNAPMVVGMSVTNSATSTSTDKVPPAYRAKLGIVATAKTKMIVMPASRMLSAISLGVFCRSAPSTSAIMRSRKVLPLVAVIFTTIQSDNTRVPPVTAERSPPDSRMTGALSPVMADSSTEATPSTISPSEGINSPASTSTRLPRSNCVAGTLRQTFIC